MVSHHEGVHGCRSHGWRRVDKDGVEVGQDGLQLSTQEQLSIDLLGFQEVVGFNVNGVGKKFELRTNFDEIAVNLRYFVDQKPMGGESELVEVDTEPAAEIPLLI